MELYKQILSHHDAQATRWYRHNVYMEPPFHHRLLIWCYIAITMHSSLCYLLYPNSTKRQHAKNRSQCHKTLNTLRVYSVLRQWWKRLPSLRIASILSSLSVFIVSGSSGSTSRRRLLCSFCLFCVVVRTRGRRSSRGRWGAGGRHPGRSRCRGCAPRS